MLVHKRTLGVLNYMWNAKGTKLVQASFCTYPEAKPDEWWEVDTDSSLAYRIELCYPDFIPITDDYNQLIDIQSTKSYDRQEARRKRKEEMKKTAKEKGYERYYNRGNRTSVLDFLSDALGMAARGAKERTDHGS